MSKNWRLLQLLPVKHHHRVLARRDDGLSTPLYKFSLIGRHDIRKRLPVMNMLVQGPTEIAGVVYGVVETLATVCISELIIRINLAESG